MIRLKHFKDLTQFGVNHLPVCSEMNVQDVVNEGVREDDTNYISCDSECRKVEIIQTTID